MALLSRSPPSGSIYVGLHHLGRNHFQHNCAVSLTLRQMSLKKWFLEKLKRQAKKW